MQSTEPHSAPKRASKSPALAAPAFKRTPRRTLFALTLQIGRARSALILLVKHISQAPALGASSLSGAPSAPAKEIARAILTGARDRSADRHQRSVYYAQQSSEALTKARTRPKNQKCKKTPSRTTAFPPFLYGNYAPEKPLQPKKRKKVSRSPKIQTLDLS